MDTSFINWLEGRQDQVSAVERVLMRFRYTGIDVLNTPSMELEKQLVANNLVPPGINPERFVAMVQSRARGGTDPDQDVGDAWRPQGEGIPLAQRADAEALADRVWGWRKYRGNA